MNREKQRTQNCFYDFKFSQPLIPDLLHLASSFYIPLFVSACYLLRVSNDMHIIHQILKQYQTLKCREGLYLLAKLVPHLCLLVNLTWNYAYCAFCKAQTVSCEQKKLKWPNLYLTGKIIMKEIFYTSRGHIRALS